MVQSENSNVVNWEAYWTTAKEQDLLNHEPLTSCILGFSVLLLSTLVGTGANILALRYFFTKSNTFFNAFKMVALSDILICQLSTFYGISLVTKRAPMTFANESFCLAWNVMWRGVVRFSLHLVAIQSALRTHKICRPLAVLPKHISTVLVSLDFTLIFGVIFLAKTQFTPVYTKSYGSCREHDIRKPPNGVPANRIWHFGAILYNAIPYPIILTCCVMCLVQLLRGNKAAASRSRPRGLARHRTQSTISLLAFSCTGLFFNLATFGPVFVRASFYGGFDVKDGTQVWFLLYGNVIFREVFVTLNSVINPFIFLWRMVEFRENVLLSVFQPISATLSEYCCWIGSQTQGRVEPEVDETNNVHQNPQDYHQNNIQKLNSSSNKDDSVELRFDPSTITSSQPSNLATITSHDTPHTDLCPIGSVIVHENAINLDHENLCHSEKAVSDETSDLCVCECCFFEGKKIKD